MKDNFISKKITDHIYRIQDKFNVVMYLVVGDKKKCLIDTGFGLRGLHDFVDKISNLPTIVLLSHGHVDHAMGSYEFNEVYMNSKDIPVYEVHKNIEYREKFIKNSYGMFDLKYLQPLRTKKFLELNHHDVFDLGNVKIKTYHVPGHTEGSMMFLIKEDRAILFGDACGPGTLLIENFSSNISDYLKGLLNIKQIENEYDLILRNHGTFQSEKELLDNVIEICNDILLGKDDKCILPESMKELFPIYSNLDIYSGRKIINDPHHGIVREDHKEGNISYRIDKAI